MNFINTIIKQAIKSARHSTTSRSSTTFRLDRVDAAAKITKKKSPPKTSFIQDILGPKLAEKTASRLSPERIKLVRKYHEHDVRTSRMDWEETVGGFSWIFNPPNFWAPFETPSQLRELAAAIRQYESKPFVAENGCPFGPFVQSSWVRPDYEDVKARWWTTPPRQAQPPPPPQANPSQPPVSVPVITITHQVAPAAPPSQSPSHLPHQSTGGGSSSSSGLSTAQNARYRMRY